MFVCFDFCKKADLFLQEIKLQLIDQLHCVASHQCGSLSPKSALTQRYRFETLFNSHCHFLFAEVTFRTNQYKRVSAFTANL